MYMKFLTTLILLSLVGCYEFVEPEESAEASAIIGWLNTVESCDQESYSGVGLMRYECNAVGRCHVVALCGSGEIVFELFCTGSECTPAFLVE